MSKEARGWFVGGGIEGRFFKRRGDRHIDCCQNKIQSIVRNSSVPKALLWMRAADKMAPEFKKGLWGFPKDIQNEKSRNV